MEKLMRCTHERKKRNLEKAITEFVGAVLDKAQADDKPDHFNIEISNHQGHLQMDFTFKHQGKAY